MANAALPESHLIRRILFATDFSESAREAQDHAVLWAGRWGATLTVLHVLDFPPGMDLDHPVHQMYLDQVRGQAEHHISGVIEALEESGAQASYRIEVGIPSQKINAIARELDSDLVILGTRGLSGLEHVLVGSTAERVVRSAPCPVLAARISSETDRRPESQAPQPSLGIQHILVPIDFSDCSLEALEYAIAVAKVYEAVCTILHVPEPISFGLDFTLRHVQERRRMRERIDSWLSELQALLVAQGLEAGYRLVDGAPADSILTSASVQPCDLIIMGTHGRRGLAHAVGGSVAEAVLRHAPCPVLTVKSPKFAPAHRRVLSEASKHLTQQFAGEEDTYARLR